MFALMTAALLLPGCGGAAKYEEDVSRYRESLCNVSGISMTAEIRADYGERVLDYTLHYEENLDGNTVEVLLPKLIAGVKAHFPESGGTLEFDGLILETGDLTSEGMNPISALPEIVKSLKSGYLQKMWREKTDDGYALVLQLAISDTSSQTIWIDSAGMIPIYAEIKNDNRTVFFCTITDWTVM